MLIGLFRKRVINPSPKTLCPKFGKWLVGSDNLHSMVDGFRSYEAIKRVGMHARQLAAEKNNVGIHWQDIDLKKC